MDWSEEDQKVAVSAASAMSLKRSISSLDLAADARAARAGRSAQPSNKEGLEDPTVETRLKDTGLPPSSPAPPFLLTSPLRRLVQHSWAERRLHRGLPCKQ